MIRETPWKDKIIILGDFNAQVGRDSNVWIGKRGTGNANANGRLLELCRAHNLV